MGWLVRNGEWRTLSSQGHQYSQLNGHGQQANRRQMQRPPPQGMTFSAQQLGVHAQPFPTKTPAMDSGLGMVVTTEGYS